MLLSYFSVAFLTLVTFFFGDVDSIYRRQLACWRLYWSYSYICSVCNCFIKPHRAQFLSTIHGGTLIVLLILLAISDNFLCTNLSGYHRVCSYCEHFSANPTTYGVILKLYC